MHLLRLNQELTETVLSTLQKTPTFFLTFKPGEKRTEISNQYPYLCYFIKITILPVPQLLH